MSENLRPKTECSVRMRRMKVWREGWKDGREGHRRLSHWVLYYCQGEYFGPRTRMAISSLFLSSAPVMGRRVDV